MSWFDTKSGRIVTALLGLLGVSQYWLGDGINLFGLVLILSVLPGSPLVRDHVFATGFVLIGLYVAGVGLWRGEPVHVVVGAVFVLFWGTGEILLCSWTRRSQRLSDDVVAMIARQPPQLFPRYNLRLTNGDVVYWPVIGGAYLRGFYGRRRLDFSPKDVVDIDPAPRERVW